MLKFLSYLSLFLGIIFIAIAKSGGDYLDLALLLPSVFFSWLTLFHHLKNNLKFEKWHLYVGMLGGLFAAATLILSFQLLWKMLESGSYNNPAIVIITIRILFDMLIIVQLIAGFKANQKLIIKQTQ